MDRPTELQGDSYISPKTLFSRVIENITRRSYIKSQLTLSNISRVLGFELCTQPSPLPLGPPLTERIAFQPSHTPYSFAPVKPIRNPGKDNERLATVSSQAFVLQL